jgi:peptide/nickel transport system substrate-binding protein
MRHFVWRWLAISSILGIALAARAETRPQYGGTLRLAMRAAPATLDPAGGADSFSRNGLTRLMFETLVVLDDHGRLQPCLAQSWQVAANRKRWQFRLRRGVKLHDDLELTPEIVAASLRVANPAWRVDAESDGIVIESSDPDLLAELALPRNAIVARNSGKLEGTGPFQITDWQSGKKLTLVANESYWGGRPFLDGIEIEMGKSDHDQMMDLELGRADLVEIEPEQVHRASLEAHTVTNSAPLELIAVVFAHDAGSSDQQLLRQALALSVDRTSIRNVLLQGTGQPAGGLLPDWMGGYEFVFPTDADLAAARQARGQAQNPPAWSLGYDGNDPLACLMAERIILNARDAGLSLRLTTNSTADLRLARIALPSADPWVALSAIAAATGVNVPNGKGDSASDLYATEQSMLATKQIIPLFHLPVSYAAASRLKDWTVRPDGSWNLANAWLANGGQ